MTVPTCSVHAVPMRKSSKGTGFYCAQKLPDGSWCKEKALTSIVLTPMPATAEVPATASQASSASATSDDALAVAALGFASRLLGTNTTPEQAYAAMMVAVKVYQTMKAIA